MSRDRAPTVECVCCGRDVADDTCAPVHLDGRALDDRACPMCIAKGCPLCREPLDDGTPLVIVAGRLGHLDCYEEARRMSEGAAREAERDLEDATAGGANEGQ